MNIPQGESSTTNSLIRMKKEADAKLQLGKSLLTMFSINDNDLKLLNYRSSRSHFWALAFSFWKIKNLNLPQK